MNTFWFDPRELAASAARYWWLFIISGVLWLGVSLIIFRFDWATVLAIAVLFGTIAIIAGMLEIAAAAASTDGWRILRGALGGLFIVIGIVSFFQPGGTFVALAALVSFFFAIAGAFDIVNAIATRAANPVWWFQLLAGALEVGLGFWAAGYWSRSVILLVTFVGALAVFRGVSMIVLGFKLLSLQREGQTTTAARPATRTPQPA
ncbi:MAG: HdeD family acid-resistance protein [Gaiellaceae bacterium]